MDSVWHDFVNSRIEDFCDKPRKKNELFKIRFKRLRELRALIDEIDIDKDTRKLLEEYFAVEFNVAAALQPALYRQGMVDAVWILQTLEVL